MPGKPLDPDNLKKDLSYVLEGTFVDFFLFRYVCRPRFGLKVFEPACGSGKLSMRYWFAGAECHLVDIDPGVVAYAEKLLSMFKEAQFIPEHTLPPPAIVCEDFLTAQHRPEYDLCFSEGFTHHFPRDDPRRQGSIDAMAAMAKPGGTVCVIGSNAHCPEMMEYAAKVDHTYHNMPPRQTPMTMEEIHAMMIKAGLRDVQVVPVPYPGPGFILGPYWAANKLLGAWGQKP